MNAQLELLLAKGLEFAEREDAGIALRGIQILSGLVIDDYAWKSHMVAAGVVPALLKAAAQSPHLMAADAGMGRNRTSCSCCGPHCSSAQVASALWGLICGHPANKKAVAQQGALPFLVNLLKDENSACLRYGALAIWSAAYGVPENQEAAVRLGAGPLLVALISHPSAAVQYAAAGALWHISAHPAYREQLAWGDGAAPALVALLQPSRPRSIAPHSTAFASVEQQQLGPVEHHSRPSSSVSDVNGGILLADHGGVLEEDMQMQETDRAPNERSQSGQMAFDQNRGVGPSQSPVNGDRRTLATDSRNDAVLDVGAEDWDEVEESVASFQKENRKDARLMACLTLGNLSLASPRSTDARGAQHGITTSEGVAKDEEQRRWEHLLEAVKDYVESLDVASFQVRLLWTTVQPLVDLLYSRFSPVQALAAFLIAAMCRNNDHKSKFFTQGAVEPLQAVCADYSTPTYVRHYTTLALLQLGLTPPVCMPPGNSEGRLQEWLATAGLEELLPVLRTHQVAWLGIKTVSVNEMTALGIPPKLQARLATAIEVEGHRQHATPGGGSSTQVALGLKGSNSSDSLGRGPACLVCLDKHRDVCLVPCGHVATCLQCAQCLYARGDPCPLCRAPLTAHVKPLHI